MSNGLMDNQMDNGFIEELRDAFSLFDKNGDGTINSEELSAVLIGLGQNPDEQELDQMIKEADADGNEMRGQEAWLMAKKMHAVEPADEMLEAFRVFDLDHDSRITVTELKRVVANLGESLSDEEIEEMIRQAEAFNDEHPPEKTQGSKAGRRSSAAKGYVTYEEWVNFMTNAPDVEK